MDPNQNSDQAGQIPSIPQNDSNVVPDASPAPEPPIVPEPASAPEPEPIVVPEVPSGTMEEVPPPPPVVEEHQEAGQTNDPQSTGSDTNQTA